MNENQGILKMYNEEEIKQLLNSNERLVYIDDGTDEIVARYEDLPDIIVDVNEKLGHTENLKVYDFDNQLLDKPILTTIGYPIFRDTVIYQKFSCYKKGFIDRKIRPLERLANTYYTVEQLKANDKESNQEPKLDTAESKIKTKLVSIINEVLKVFGKIDFNVEYVKDDNNIIAQLYLAPPLSTNDLKELEELSSKLDFFYNAISDKGKVNRKNRNSLIEVFLVNKEKEM